MAFQSHGLNTAYRSAVASADNATRATFEAASTDTVQILGDDEVWVRAVLSTNGATATGTVFFYTAAGTFLGISPTVTLDATALIDGSSYMSATRVTANPGAALARLHLTTISAGTADLYLGGRSASSDP